jgi:hypothetical protein
MELINDEVKARRLARVIMDNVEQYNPALVKKGIEEGIIFELLHDQIEEARNAKKESGYSWVLGKQIWRLICRSTVCILCILIKPVSSSNLR